MVKNPVMRSVAHLSRIYRRMPVYSNKARGDLQGYDSKDGQGIYTVQNDKFSDSVPLEIPFKKFIRQSTGVIGNRSIFLLDFQA